MSLQGVPRPTPLPRPGGGLGLLVRRVPAYLRLTKPNIVVLLLVTALAGALAGGKGTAPWGTVLAVLVGGALCAGSANAFNSILDWHIDRRMARTRGRPIPAGQVQRRPAFLFALALGAVSLLVFALGTNPLATALAAAALVYYVVGYSLYLKPRTPQNIVIGGGAGAFPPLIGWTAVTGTLDPPAVFLFLTIFFWTPPHFWALSLVLKEDYARAGVPMLPVVAGEEETRAQISLYSLALLALSLIPSALGYFGWVYLVGVGLLGMGMVALAERLRRRPSLRTARLLYRYSDLYLAFYFLVLVADRALAP